MIKEGRGLALNLSLISDFYIFGGLKLSQLSKVEKGKETPLMQQYYALKGQHKDALLLFRVGDFYETFGEDAVKASNALGITLTARNNGGSNIELAGFPYHSLDVYLPKLVRAGFRVAICEQLEKPSKETKVVKRGITDVVTPGLGTSDNLLDRNENNYLAAVYFANDKGACALLDLSTGDFMVYEGRLADITKLISTYSPKEILYAKRQKPTIDDHVDSTFYTYGLDDWIFQEEYGRDKLMQLFQVQSLKAYSIDHLVLAQISAGAILQYLETTENRQLRHINKIVRIQLERYVWLDQFTIRNLELIHPNHPSGVPLAQILDHTVTAMGARMLRKWILLPLTDIDAINYRLSIVESLVNNMQHSAAIDQHLKAISDLERLIAKVALNKVSPREVEALKLSLLQIPFIKKQLIELPQSQTSKLAHQLDEAQEICQKIADTLADNPPHNLAKGSVIATSVHEELDEYRDLIANSKRHLEAMLQKEITATGITNLKVGYNNVFGYYYEVTNRYKDHDLIPTSWTRKQTLTNAERYISEELKQLEIKILSAEEKILALEELLFQQLIDWLSNHIRIVQHNADILAQIDCLNSFAKVAKRQHYCKPSVSESYELQLEQARHPVIEAHLPLGQEYIPNDLTLSNEGEQILLITGPNMSGKSAILRQTALICLMAQMGSFVSARKAHIGIVDRIFTRVGASDNISSGESTFMVEMTETASIMNNLSDRSLILLDEIGRGTSTYDGISIAWSIVEYLHEIEAKPKTLFATHYHELSQLADKYSGIANYNVATKELGDKIVFLRKLIKGSSNQSFGIQVAHMSGMPADVVSRAKDILLILQKQSVLDGEKTKKTLHQLEKRANIQQLSLFQADPALMAIHDQLLQLDPNNMTPIDCMMKLSELRKLIN